jgi:hypothetical protein
MGVAHNRFHRRNLVRDLNNLMEETMTQHVGSLNLNNEELSFLEQLLTKASVSGKYVRILVGIQDKLKALKGEEVIAEA